MSEEDQTFTSKGIFREETLYYDLGYRFAQLRDRTPQKMLDLDLTGYLFAISLILQFVFVIQQILTLAIIVIFFVYSSFISTAENKSASIIVLGTLFLANVLDHILGGVFITPGLIITGRLSFVVWVLELVWILLFSTQIIITLQPVTPVFLKGLSVQPETVKAKKDYEFLKFRTQGTDYEVEDVHTSLDLELLRENLIYLLRMIGAVVSAALLIDVFIWTIVGQFGGGANVSEQYFISGLILVLFIFIYVSTGMLFSNPSENNNNEPIDPNNSEFIELIDESEN
ncbi:MAG: hypothetical protein GPJ54_08440 [Candidatus Heimdallarchaeota archaeon]|nr:hypothetical protein [Candidatus Heimdallarchaeota archaeon]